MNKKIPFQFPILAYVSGLGTGYFPFASGTVGSAFAIALVWFFQPGTLWLVSLSALILITGSLACDIASQVLDKVDSSKIVLDEIVGILITMIGIPLTNYWLVVGFLLFRFFDIIKPPPASYFDSKMKNGWGVMLDDVIARIYSNAIMHIMIATDFKLAF